MPVWLSPQYNISGYIYEGTQKVFPHTLLLSQERLERAEILCRNNYITLFTSTILVCSVYRFLPPGNKGLYFLLVKVLWGLSEPHPHSSVTSSSLKNISS
jgi:hypothetical protein